MSNIKTPHAAVIIWNYRDRIGSEGAFDVDTIEQIILSTVSLKEINTSKTKSQPVGSFQLKLAPTKNWVTSITPGSWCAILMTQKQITKKDVAKYGGTADCNKVKMLGRIESVRAHVTVNQTTGARQTEYIVSGVDWGYVFTSVVYVDPIAKGDDKDALTNAWRLVYDNMTIDLVDKGGGEIPSSDDNIKALINLWGHSNSMIESAENNESLNTPTSRVILKPDLTFTMPKEVMDFFRFHTSKDMCGRSIADTITFFSGVVKRAAPILPAFSESANTFVLNKAASNEVYYDNYSFIRDAAGIIQPDAIFGQHSIWQLLYDNCNNVINELVTDMRWDENGRPSLALYKRIRPFIIRKNFEGADKVKDLIANMDDVRTINIPAHEIVTANAGTNWRDKYNFIEIMLDNSFQALSPNQYIKTECQTFDEKAFAREGFRPMFVSSKYLPTDITKTLNPFDITQWKYLLREWHFNSHVLLNGSITFIGQNNYIQVGDNIMFDERVLTETQNVNANSVKIKKNNPYIMGHVESVSHAFTVSENGARQFLTTVEFVRGIVIDYTSRRPLGADLDGRLDIDATKVAVNDELNSKTVLGVSEDIDPDIQKIGK